MKFCSSTLCHHSPLILSHSNNPPYRKKSSVMEPECSFLAIIGNYWILSWATWTLSPSSNTILPPTTTVSLPHGLLQDSEPKFCNNYSSFQCMLHSSPTISLVCHFNMGRVHSVCSLLNDAFSRSDFIASRLTVHISKPLIMQFPPSYSYFLSPRRRHLNKYHTKIWLLKNMSHAQFRGNKCDSNIHFEVGTYQNLYLYYIFTILYL
jgi:hypothetical protein